MGDIPTHHRAVASVPNISERDDLIVRDKFVQGRKGYFISSIPTYRISHTMTFGTPFVENWLERETVQWVHHEGSILRPIADALLRIYLSLHPSERQKKCFIYGCMASDI